MINSKNGPNALYCRLEKFILSKARVSSIFLPPPPPLRKVYPVSFVTNSKHDFGNGTVLVAGVQDHEHQEPTFETLAADFCEIAWFICVCSLLTQTQRS